MEGNNHLTIQVEQRWDRDPRHYNLPTSDEIAGIIPNNANASAERDIILFKTDNTPQRISSWHPAYACLHYVLLFP